MVQHNQKKRIIFNCAYEYRGLNLNNALLPGPTLGHSLLSVLLRFRQHSVAISRNIKGMFHQFRLLPEDKPLLRFVWLDLKRDMPPDIYKWQVLPFGMTCSPRCATFALQWHVIDHSSPDEDVGFSVERCFYVDNCLQSIPSVKEARQLLDKLRALLSSGGFEIRQWTSNVQSVVSHLPQKALSNNTELWLSQDQVDMQEATLSLRWHCPSDTIGLWTMAHQPCAMFIGC